MRRSIVSGDVEFTHERIVTGKHIDTMILTFSPTTGVMTAHKTVKLCSMAWQDQQQQA